jgi:hypothetical protein
VHLRVATGQRAQLVAILWTACAIGACRVPPAFELSWNIDNRPSSSDLLVEVSIRDRMSGQPLTGADLTLEGHMSHPGMAPIVSAAEEAEDGRYRARMALTMAGEWKFVLSGTLADGRRVIWEHDGVTIPAAGP